MAGSGKRRGGLPGFYARPLKRLKEIQTLARWRQMVDGHTAPHRALAVAGHALAALEGMRRRNQPRHPGFDFSTADEFLDRAGLGLTARDIEDIVGAVGRARCCERPFVMTAVEAGRLLDLTRDERTNLGITTMEAIDEAPADRAARVAEWKRINDRIRRQEETDRKRAEKGLPPLDRTRTNSPAPKPWEALGMTKATYYRRKAKGLIASETPVSRTYAEAGSETPVSPSYTAGSETDVSRSLRSNGEVVRHAGLTCDEPFTLDDAARIAALRPSTFQEAEAAILKFVGRGSVRRGKQIAERIDRLVLDLWADMLLRGEMTAHRFMAANEMMAKAKVRDAVAEMRGAA